MTLDILGKGLEKSVLVCPATLTQQRCLREKVSEEMVVILTAMQENKSKTLCSMGQADHMGAPSRKKKCRLKDSRMHRASGTKARQNVLFFLLLMVEVTVNCYKGV